jgi:hypothetical protein
MKGKAKNPKKKAIGAVKVVVYHILWEIKM